MPKKSMTDTRFAMSTAEVGFRPLGIDDRSSLVEQEQS